MRRVPLLATLVVVLAVAAMIALGFWQIRRAAWKEGLLARYHAAEKAPPLYGLPADVPVDTLAFRRTHVQCRVTPASTEIGGTNRAGQTGYRNIVGCTLIDGRVILADLGWSAIGVKPVLPAAGQRIEAAGQLIPDEPLARRLLGDAPGVTPLLLVFEGGVAGLEPSVAPSIEAIPNNHRGYAGQWFTFAGIALAIYLLALRQRNQRK